MSDDTSQLVDDQPNEDRGMEKPPEKRFKRSHGACRRCHTYKIKCSGEHPCQNCTKSTVTAACVYPVKDRNIVVKQRYIEQLEAEIDALKHKSPSHRKPDLVAERIPRRAPLQESIVESVTALSETLVDDDDGGIPASVVHEVIADNAAAAEDADFAGPTEVGMSGPLHVQFVKDGDVQSLSAYVGEAACEAFTTRVLQYLNNDETISPPRHDRYFKSKHLSRSSKASLQLPDRGYAMLLVDVADRMVGAEYHMFLRQPFMRKLNELYQTMVFKDPVWLCGMFAIFALGEMYSSSPIRSGFAESDIPGAGFFVQAMELYQDLHEEATTQYIETLLLLSYYSHALNRRNTAYTFTGIALRLSLTLGLHRDTPNQLATGLEREHRRRVWWTVYTLDRLCSLKLGHPIMIRDEDIDVKLPSTDNLTADEMVDLPNPQQLVSSVALARIAGEILQQLYCVSKPRTGVSGVQSIQTILLSLKAFAEGLPPELKLEKIMPAACPGRALASLHVYFNHCVILTTRPVLFYVFRLRFAPPGRSKSTSRGVSPISDALSKACIHAATASHHILRNLWTNGLITMLGGFDAHYLFSATIILTMAYFMHPLETSHSVVESCWTMLKTMGSNGNLSAQGYHEQISQLRQSLEETVRMKSSVETTASSKLAPSSVTTDSQQLASHPLHQQPQQNRHHPEQQLGSIECHPLQFDMTPGLNTTGVNGTTTELLNNPNIVDFLTHRNLNGLQIEGCESLIEQWDFDWGRDLLSWTAGQ